MLKIIKRVDKLYFMQQSTADFDRYENTVQSPLSANPGQNSAGLY